MAVPVRKFFSLLRRSRDRMKSLSGSQNRHLRNELNQVRGLIPLLMKRRNGEKWSKTERAILLKKLRSLSNLSPYLIPIIMPGGIFMLPLVAYWMDQRRNERK